MVDPLDLLAPRLEFVLASATPGDCNGDGRTDISDLLCITNILILGVTDPPCEEAFASPGNTALLDWNGDGRVDVSDAIFGAGFLFGTCPSGAPCPEHALGTACIRIEGCEDQPRCE